MTQVVIIGAGPTGLTLAMLFAQKGITVKLIEASRSFRRIFRGEALMPSGLDAIAQLGLADIVEQSPHRSIDAWEFYIENRPLFRVNEPMEDGGKPCTLISQPALLEAVVKKANECKSFELIQGTAQELLWQNDRVSGVKLSNDKAIAADLVIGADGRNSILRQKANLTFKQDEQSFDILWFKLPASPQFAPENVFYSVVRDRNGFGLFQGSQGNIQVGWSLHKDDPIEWQTIDWSQKLASASPDWLAAYFRQQVSIRPLLLSVVVGRCLHWQKPGLLLLGDAAHPMSPIRAQGINMALRDVVVAANYLVPLLQSQPNFAAIDAILPQIQAEREPEIIQIQKLQRAEFAQAELLRNNPLLRYGVSRLAPLLGSKIRQSWLKRQRKLRQGFSQVNLKV